MVLRKVERLSLRDAKRVQDPRFPGWFLYPADQRIEGLPPCQVPQTHYLILRTSGAPLTQMLSTGPDGLDYGWDSCGGCDQYLTRCVCVFITPPKYIRKWLQFDAAPIKAPGLVPVSTVVQEKPLRRVEAYDYGPSPIGLGEITRVEPVPDMATLDEVAGEGAMLSKLRKKLQS